MSAGFDLLIGADGLHPSVRKLAFGPQSRIEKHLGYVVAAFETRGYRPRDEDLYLIYGQPGHMVGRFTLHKSHLMVFAAVDGDLPATLDVQKRMLREVYGHNAWECPRILDELDRAEALYFDSVSQIKMPNWSSRRAFWVMRLSACRCWRGRVRRWQ